MLIRLLILPLFRSKNQTEFAAVTALTVGAGRNRTAARMVRHFIGVIPGGGIVEDHLYTTKCDRRVGPVHSDSMGPLRLRARLPHTAGRNV